MSNVMSYCKSIVESKIREMKMIMKKLISNLLIHNFRNRYVQRKSWGKTALQIDDDFYKSNRDPFIVIVTSTIVKAYKGNISLSILTIELKSFQLVLEEGGLVYNHQIYERGKDFMSSVFMDKNTSRWLLKSIEDVVLKRNQKQFVTTREGDADYKKSNAFGHYLNTKEGAEGEW